MDNLHFSARARQRHRLKRYVVAASILSMLVAPATSHAPSFESNLFESNLVGWVGRRNHDAVATAATVETSETARQTLRFRRGLLRARVTPTPEPSPTPEPTTAAEPSGDEAPVAATGEPVSVTDAINAAAAEYGVDAGLLLSIASCESNLDPRAHNPAGYYGLFQFDESTWASYGGGSIYDPVAQARTAAMLVAQGQTQLWPNCA